ncbi:DcaP family trimeric outer membrane transporter [Collimonas humicola]|uniref:DcaP family trimeric outer membrane transporter n=1 Tax=Collimonas humicola TaxID=2825886 RepID=UPI001B8B53FF|nr:DcaP family trimeric outer membrane transporter [Collimonas humicola]
MKLKHACLSTSIVFIFSGAAIPSYAQTAQDFEQMRAEIKRLSEQLNQLTKAKSAAPQQDLVDRIEQVELSSKDAVVAGDIPGSFRLPNSETSVHLYGFGELNWVHEMRGDNSSNDYSTFLAYAPLRGVAAGPNDPSIPANKTGRDYLTARTSRFGIETSTPSSYGPISIKVEGDFNNDPRTGNSAVSGTAANIYTQQSTNSYNFRLREAYGQFNGFLIGQTWSTFMDVDNAPETVDFNGPIGSTFIRQPQIRYSYPTKDFGKFSVALENSVSYVLDRTGAVDTNGFSHVPDLVGRWDKTFDWGAVSLRGVTQDNRVNDGAGASLSRRGYGLAASGTYKTWGDDSMNWAITGGTGIGRYFNYIEGAFFDDVNHKLLLEKVVGVVLGYQHKPSATLRFNGSIGFQRNFNNDYTAFAMANGLGSGNGALGNFAINRELLQSHLGFIWNPVANVDIGAEYIFGRRKTLADETAYMSRVDLSAKYHF